MSPSEIALLAVCSLLFSPSVFAEGSRPFVNTTLGALRGTWLTSAQGKQYAAFMTVPFAKPPIGALRFEPPMPVAPWDGEWDAGQPTPMCLSFSHKLNPLDKKDIKGQEDCLYLNVYTPQLPNGEGRLLPVIVFIHGGAFMFSGSALYGAKFLMDRDVVMVSINYRLGPLGFLSLEDDVVPGNNGMRDQVLALQWVQDHIAQFGGNRSSVTVLGQSAGGSSAHFHYISPLSQGLLHRGISMSGTALCRWALTNAARQKALRLAASVGCPTEHNSSQRILDCLKNRPARHILKQVAQFQVWHYSPFTPFGPVLERPEQTLPPFLPVDPFVALKRGEIMRAPWMTGVTVAEGLYPAASFVGSDRDLEILDREFSRLAPHLLDFNFTVPVDKHEYVTARIRNEYLASDAVSSSTVPKLLKMMSDRLFVVDAQKAVEIQSLFTPVYFYVFDFRGDHSLSDIMSATKRNFGVAHADDVMYITNVTYIPDVPFSGDELRIQKLLLDLVTSFATYGTPESPEMTSWSPNTPRFPLKFLNIRTIPPEMDTHADLGNTVFWDSLPFLENPQPSYINNINNN